MSYILDALQRAEAERGRGQAPGPDGLHGLPATPPPTAAPASPFNTPVAKQPWARLGWWAAGAVAVLATLVAALVWQPSSVDVPPTGQPAAPAQIPAPVPAPVSAPVPVPAPVPLSAPKPKPKPTPKSAPQAPVTTTNALTSNPAPLLTDLPDAVRRDVPSLQITGAVYSANPAQRLLVVNNQVLNQGSQVAPGVVLEDIQPHSAVFSVKGTRFRLNH